MRVLRVLPLLAFGLLTGLAAQGQPAFLTKDVNTTSVQHPQVINSYRRLAALGNVIFFTADDAGAYGLELWRTDGTFAGTSMVKDICPGSCSSAPRALTVSNGALYFIASDGEHGPQLWKSDGTSQGTVSLTDFPEGSFGVYDLIDAAGVLLFSADDGVHGLELWTSDGTAAGTQILKEIAPGTGGIFPRFLATSGQKVLVAIAHGTNWSEPWVSDGTAAGTVQVAQIRSDPANAIDLYYDPLTSGADAAPAPQGGFLFAADDGTGTALWYTDGTPGGTTTRIASASSPHGMTVFQGAVYFAASDPAAGVELWKSDGTPLGTARLKDLQPGVSGSDPRDLTVAGGRLYFHATDGLHGRELWKTDGTALGTVGVTALNPGAADAFPVTPGFPSRYQLAPLGNDLIFFARDPSGLQLWRTEAGFNITELSGAGFPDHTILAERALLPLGGNAYFLGGSTSTEIWTSDGTPAGTHVIRDVASETSSLGLIDGKLTQHAFAPLGSLLLFTAIDGIFPQIQPWKTDGTAVGTSPFAALPSSASGVIPVGGRALFPTYPSFWSSDGTAGGTFSLDGGNSPFGSFPSLGGSLFYVAYDSVSPFNQALWRTDGTLGGTSKVAYLSTFLEGFTMTAFGGRIFVAGAENGSGYSFWVTDGTAPGTVHISGLAHGQELAGLDAFIPAGGTLFFTAYENGGYGREVWKTDGTAAGTVLLKSIPPDLDDFLTLTGEAAAPAGGPLFFVAGDSTTGSELWKSDGTAAGTVLVADIRPGSQGSRPHSLTPVGNKLYFVANDGVHGNEVWVSDGTAAGTHLAVDLLPGPGSSQPDSLAAVGNTLLFSAHDNVHGVEAWRTDGTALGTRMIQDIAPGPLSSSPTGFTVAGPNVYFAADDNITGFEVWAVPQDAVLGTFADVPPTYWAWRFIESLLRNGVTSGCGGGNFCPGAYVNRAQMAIFVLAARGTPPPPATGTRFDDVPAGYWAGPWIEELAREGVVGGCSTNPPLYCPDSLLTRAEMAVLITLARHENPPPATGTRFGDVPADYWAARFIEQLAADGVTSGCGGGNYCPDQPITRGEMAVFLATAFHLPLP